MRGINDILEEIERLKSTWKSWHDLEKLDLLERTLERYSEPEPSYSRASIPESNDFAVIAAAVPKELLISVMSEHMDTIKQIYPKEYDLIIGKLRTA